MSDLFESAKVHIDRGEIDHAIPVLIDHLNGHFHDEVALFMLGACFIQKGKNGIGAALTRQAIEIRNKRGANFPEALKNLGACFRNENKPDVAREIWEVALTVETDKNEQAQILSNIGGSYVNNGSPEKAVEYYDRSLAIRPDLLTVRFNRGLALLEQGKWREGWEEYFQGFGSGDRVLRRYGSIPEWDGTSDKTLIVWGEQGVGDEIMFASCLPDLIKVSKKVIFDCHPRLVELFKRSFPGIEIHGTRKTLSNLTWVDTAEADAAVCISTLPKWFRNQDSDFPGVPYLKPGEWARGKTPLRIGISWTGGTKLTNTDLRSIKLKKWEPLLKSIEGAEFYSLQYTPDAAREVCALEEKTGLHVKHWPSWVQARDYDRTAAFVGSMDLVITVCTAVHHLANAIGVPTWTLVPSKPAWRYGIGGENWYRSTSTFFRQAEGEGWGSVLARVETALKDFHADHA